MQTYKILLLLIHKLQLLSFLACWKKLYHWRRTLLVSCSFTLFRWLCGSSAPPLTWKTKKIHSVINIYSSVPNCNSFNLLEHENRSSPQQINWVRPKIHFPRFRPCSRSPKSLCRHKHLHVSRSWVVSKPSCHARLQVHVCSCRSPFFLTYRQYLIFLTGF